MFHIKRISEKIYKRGQEPSKKLIYKLIFALAVACKITPAKLVKSLDKKVTDKYAKEFSEKVEKSTKVSIGLEHTKKD